MSELGEICLSYNSHTLRNNVFAEGGFPFGPEGGFPLSELGRDADSSMISGNNFLGSGPVVEMGSIGLTSVVSIASHNNT